MKLALILVLALSVVACSAGVYKQSPALNSSNSASIQIDGAKTSSRSLLTARTSYVKIEEYLGDCNWDYKGFIYASSDKSSAVVKIPAGKLMGLHFVRQVTQGNLTTDYEHRAYIVPKKGVTYVFEPLAKDDAEPNIYQVIGAKKAHAQGFVAKPKCN